MTRPDRRSGLTRRAALAASAAALLPATTTAKAQTAPRETLASVERTVLAGRTPLAAGVTLDMPTLSENGNSVDLTIRIDSPMSGDDHVTAIHVLAEKNPFPRVATFRIGPRAGRAEVGTRIRLAETQTIVVLAETSRGTVHRGAREVIVILGACVDGG
jgi:sulfur-oxidizing protein SoxY